MSEKRDLIQHSWLKGLCADPLPWLLETENPLVRYLTLTDLLDRSADDPEFDGVRQEMLAYRPVRRILDAQWPEGYWMHPASLRAGDAGGRVYPGSQPPS